jgi:hypothetical protein
MPIELLKPESLKVTNNVGVIMPSRTEEAVAFCPGCKTLETLHFSGRQLAPTRKFSQNDGHIYHDCGSIKPCQLYHMY